MNQEDLERLIHREDLKLASVSKRGVAFFIDDMLISLLLIVSLWSSLENVRSAEEMISLINTFTFEYLLVKIIYQTFFVYKYGATLGKIALKIRVIDVNTLDNPSFVVSLNRAVFRAISQMLFYLGFLWGMFDPFKRTWHDLSAKTLVIES